jgi:uncharacterized glyoxalase superfamily protein PhnB
MHRLRIHIMPQTSQFSAGPSNLSMPEATVIPVLGYPDVSAAAAWLCHVFGFSERLRIGNHRIQLSVGQGSIVVTQGEAGWAAEQFMASSVMVRVHDVDAHFRHARNSGARVLAEPVSYPYGERQYSVADLAGRAWTFSQSEANVNPADWGGILSAGAKA